MGFGTLPPPRGLLGDCRRLHEDLSLLRDCRRLAGLLEGTAG
ncbi:hypothetical protein ACFWII_04520 [Streptomyces sp. NPDC127063]